VIAAMPVDTFENVFTPQPDGVLPMKRRLFSLTAVALALAGGAVQAQTKWDLPTGYPTTNFHVENLTQFAADVDKATAGKLKINIHANASLFKANEIKRAVQSAQAPIGEFLMVNAENENAVYGVDGVPFLATSYADAKKLAAAQKPVVDKLLAAQGMKLLYTVAWPPQGIYTNKELHNVGDMKGLKWRAYSPATAKIAELVGAVPVTIQQAELSQAMATGVINSYMSSGSTGLDTKTYESIKMWYDTQAWLPKNAVVVNLAAFNALDKATQDGLLKAGAEAEARGWKTSEERNDLYKKQLAEKGMKIMPPSPQLMSDLKKVGATMLTEWQAKAGPDGAAVIDAFRK
jgi:TRAP-type C4-dicarboxylate transport system substrate-binding protein